MTQNIKAYLTNPYPNNGDAKIHAIYHELFKGIQSNSTVRVAFYMWHDTSNFSSSNPGAITDELLTKINKLSVDAQVLIDRDWSNILNELAAINTARWAGGLPDGIVYRPGSGKYYIFKGDQYTRHSHGDSPDFGYPKPLIGFGSWSGWPTSWPYGNVDSVAYYEPKDRYYLFKGSEYARHPHNLGLDSGYPKKIRGNWSGWPNSWGSGNVDAVVYYPPTKRWYLFKDDEYVRHRHAQGPDNGYPKKIAGNWSGWPDSWGSGRVDGVVWHPAPTPGGWGWPPKPEKKPADNKFYLLKGNEYVRHAFAKSEDAGYPKSITSIWSGWPSGSVKTSPLAYYPVPHKQAGLELNGSPKMHNKTVLFSKLQFDDPPTIDGHKWPSTMKYVVVESSANIYTSQYRQANQLILTYGHRELYEDALRRFKNILHRKIDAKKFPTYSPRDKNYSMFQTNDIKVYGFPRSTDLIVSILSNISNIFEAPQDKQAHIRITIADFMDRIAIAKKLTELKRIHGEDLKIEIISRDNISESVKHELRNGNPPNRSPIDLLKIDPDGDAIKIHTKALMYEGQYNIGGKSQWYRLVWCGAHNYTKPALTTNSETLWRIWNDAVYNAHVENFEAIKSTMA